MEILGIDIGASGIKGAPVDTELGSLLAERYRLPTPEIAKPGPMIELIGRDREHFKWSGGIGCGFPGVIIDGITLTAANLHQKWVGLDAARQIAEKTACPVCLINDADAAGTGRDEVRRRARPPGCSVDCHDRHRTGYGAVHQWAPAAEF